MRDPFESRKAMQRHGSLETPLAHARSKDVRTQGSTCYKGVVSRTVSPNGPFSDPPWRPGPEDASASTGGKSK